MENVLIVTSPTADAARGVLGDLLGNSGDDGFKMEAGRVLYRQPNGRVADMEELAEAPVSASATGATVGAVIGLFGGPATLLLGGAAGGLVGSMVDQSEGEERWALANMITGAVPPDTHAVVAVVSESSSEVVDRIVGEHRGSVLRQPRADVEMELATAEEAVLAAREEARRVWRTRQRVASRS